MIDISLFRKDPKFFLDSSLAKNVSFDSERILQLDSQKRDLQAKIDSIRSEKNKFSKNLSGLNGEEKNKKISELKHQDDIADCLNLEYQKVTKELHEAILEIPNPAKKDVKIGKSDRENEVIRKCGDIPEFDFPVQEYMRLAESMDLIDMPRATKVSGTRFGYIKNELVLLEFGIAQWVFQELIKEKFVPVIPPVFVREEAMKAMGYLEHGGEDETYHFTQDKLYLVGTSEQSIGPMHLNEILNEELLPIRYVGFSSCFRREAGSYGKDTKGILRVHQFDKIEMFTIVKPEDSDIEHEYLLSLEERFMQALKLPYQVVKMCTGDLGDPAARKYDIETWIPSQNKYRETHSTSTCTDYQARRLNIRFKKKSTGNNEFVHTLNGTVFAVGRILIALIENYQQKDGSILVPEILRPYVGGLTAINRNAHDQLD